MGNVPDDSVSALADNILNIVLLAHVERDLTGSGPARLIRA